MSPILSSQAGLSAKGYGLFSPALATNSYESISTVTVGAGGASSISFSSIPSTYKHLQVRSIIRTASSTEDFLVYKPNNAALSARHFVSGNGSTTGAGGSTSVFDMGSIPNSGSLSNTFGAYILDILDYADTNKNKTLRQLNGTDVNGSGGDIQLVSGLYASTSAISSLVINTYNGTSFAANSSFALYGIKG